MKDSRLCRSPYGTDLIWWELTKLIDTKSFYLDNTTYNPEWVFCYTPDARGTRLTARVMAQCVGFESPSQRPEWAGGLIVLRHSEIKGKNFDQIVEILKEKVEALGRSLMRFLADKRWEVLS